MPRLLIGNECDEDLMPSLRIRAADYTSQSIVWYAEDGDVIVLPSAPEQPFLRYVTELTGVDAATLTIVVAPPAAAQDNRLTGERLSDPAFRRELSAAAERAGVEEVLATWPSRKVTALLRDLGMADLMPGHAFVDQGGDMLAASKAAFRAVAAGNGVPLPQGAVTRTPGQAVAAATPLMAAGLPVIVKAEFNAGGAGNEILSPDAGFEAAMGRCTVYVPDGEAVERYFSENWNRLSLDGRDTVVVERFHPASRSVFAEFWITADTVDFGGDGEMLFDPKPGAEMMPASWLTAESRQRLHDGTRGLAHALQAMGYRGNLSGDAIVTPGGEVLFTEYNGRLTASTHIYRVIGRRVVGKDYARDRVLHDCLRWSVPSYEAAVAELRRSGLAYQEQTRCGVILCSAINPRHSRVDFCVISDDPESALKDAAAVRALFPAMQ